MVNPIPNLGWKAEEHGLRFGLVRICFLVLTTISKMMAIVVSMPYLSSLHDVSRHVCVGLLLLEEKLGVDAQTIDAWERIAMEANDSPERKA